MQPANVSGIDGSHAFKRAPAQDELDTRSGLAPCGLEAWALHLDGDGFDSTTGTVGQLGGAGQARLEADLLRGVTGAQDLSQKVGQLLVRPGRGPQSSSR